MIKIIFNSWFTFCLLIFIIFDLSIKCAMDQYIIINKHVVELLQNEVNNKNKIEITNRLESIKEKFNRNIIEHSKNSTYIVFGDDNKIIFYGNNNIISSNFHQKGIEVISEIKIHIKNFLVVLESYLNGVSKDILIDKIKTVEVDNYKYTKNVKILNNLIIWYDSIEFRFTNNYLNEIRYIEK